MFKILVADDEKFIRKGILSILSKNLSVEAQYIEASNGIEALERAKLTGADLIITDISMPGRSGLEFIAALKEYSANTPVIILSGYENFEYAKTAIKLGVKEYVMKPIKKQEFIELVQGYVDDIQAMQAKNTGEVIRRIENERVMRRLKHDFLVGLLKCSTSVQAKQYLAQLKDVGMTFEAKLYACAVVQYKVNSRNQDYMDFAVKNILDEYLNFEAGQDFLVNVTYAPGEVVVIFEGNSQEVLKGPKKKLMRKAVQLIEEYCKTEAYAGLGDVAYDSVHLHVALRHALLAADFKILESGDCVSVYEELNKWMTVDELGIVNRMKDIDKVTAFELLDAFQCLYQDSKKNNETLTLKKEYEEVQKFLNIQRQRRSSGQNGWEETFRPFSACWSVGELKQELKEQLEILEGLGESTGISNAKLMSQARQYVDEHITEDLDLNSVAERFNRTPGYISTLFKKYVEGGFNFYLTKGRIDIAKHLLEDGSISIQEVSEMCGYNNAKYFSVVFKKMTGDTPRGYRERFIN